MSLLRQKSLLLLFYKVNGKKDVIWRLPSLRSFKVSECPGELDVSVIGGWLTAGFQYLHNSRSPVPSIHPYRVSNATDPLQWLSVTTIPTTLPPPTDKARSQGHWDPSLNGTFSSLDTLNKNNWNFVTANGMGMIFLFRRMEFRTNNSQHNKGNYFLSVCNSNIKRGMLTNGRLGHKLLGQNFTPFRGLTDCLSGKCLWIYLLTVHEFNVCVT